MGNGLVRETGSWFVMEWTGAKKSTGFLLSRSSVSMYRFTSLWWGGTA